MTQHKQHQRKHQRQHQQHIMSLTDKIKQSGRIFAKANMELCQIQAAIMIQACCRGHLCRIRKEALMHGFLAILSKLIKQQNNVCFKATIWDRWKQHVHIRVTARTHIQQRIHQIQRMVKQQQEKERSQKRGREGRLALMAPLMNHCFYRYKEHLRVTGGMGHMSSRYLYYRRLCMSWVKFLKHVIKKNPKQTQRLQMKRI